MKNKMNDNQKLQELGITNANPFHTPDGYFDSLTTRVMENIPDIQSAPAATTVEMGHSIRRRLIYWASAIAACTLLVFTAVRLGTADDNGLTAEIQTDDDYDEEYAEEMLSYSMADGQMVYAYLADADY